MPRIESLTPDQKQLVTKLSKRLRTLNGDDGVVTAVVDAGIAALKVNDADIEYLKSLDKHTTKNGSVLYNLIESVSAQGFNEIFNPLLDFSSLQVNEIINLRDNLNKKIVEEQSVGDPSFPSMGHAVDLKRLPKGFVEEMTIKFESQRVAGGAPLGGPSDPAAAEKSIRSVDSDLYPPSRVESEALRGRMTSLPWLRSRHRGRGFEGGAAGGGVGPGAVLAGRGPSPGPALGGGGGGEYDETEPDRSSLAQRLAEDGGGLPPPATGGGGVLPPPPPPPAAAAGRGAVPAGGGGAGRSPRSILHSSAGAPAGRGDENSSAVKCVTCLSCFSVFALLALSVLGGGTVPTPVRGRARNTNQSLGANSNQAEADLAFSGGIGPSPSEGVLVNSQHLQVSVLSVEPAADNVSRVVVLAAPEPSPRGSSYSSSEDDQSDDTWQKLELKIRKSDWRNYFKSWVPNCCSSCFCGLDPSEFDEYKLKRNLTYRYEIEKDLFEKEKKFRTICRTEDSSLQINIDQDNKGAFISVSNKSNVEDFLKELTFESIKEEKETTRKNTLFKIIRLNPDVDDNKIKIGACQIDRLNIVDLTSDTYKTKIYLDDAGIKTIKDFTERYKALFLQYFLNDPNLTAKSFLDSVLSDIASPIETFDPQDQAHKDALTKASEAVERLVERKMERGDFKFNLDDHDKEIAYVKVLREIDKSGNIKKDNKVEIKTGKEFSEKLKHINLHVGDNDYIQIHLENDSGTPKVRDNLSFFRKDDKNNFNQIDLGNSKQIRSSNIKIISHDNKETKFKEGSITHEEKKSSCFSCLRKAKPTIKESGVIRYENDGWKIDFEKTDDHSTHSAKLIIDGNGRISFNEKDDVNKKLADAFRKTLGDKKEVRKFKLVKDNETYEVTIGNTQTGRTFANTCNLFSNKTHGNGILKVEKISGNNLLEGGAVFDTGNGAGKRGSSRALSSFCLGSRAR